MRSLSDADPGSPGPQTPVGLLLWVANRQKRSMAAGHVVSGATVPAGRELIGRLDTLQSNAVSLSRPVGVQEVPTDRETGDGEPTGPAIELTDVTCSYRPGHSVLHCPCDPESGSRSSGCEAPGGRRRPGSS